MLSHYTQSSSSVPTALCVRRDARAADSHPRRVCPAAQLFAALGGVCTDHRCVWRPGVRLSLQPAGSGTAHLPIRVGTADGGWLRYLSLSLLMDRGDGRGAGSRHK